jgi:putative ABC transport system permease protein
MLRSLVRRPAYALLVVTILGLGIGASTAIFGLVDAVLLRSLPYSNSESLVVVFADGTARGSGARMPTTPGDFADWRAQGEAAFSGLAAIRNVSPRITSLDTPVVPLTHAVSANYFDVLGVQPRLGRGFLPGEDTPGRDAVVVLSHGLWQAKFGGDPSIVGRTIDLDGRPYTIVGVMGPDFYSAHIFTVQPDLFVPAPFDQLRDDRSLRELLVYGRLKAGVTLQAARGEMRTAATRIAQAHPDTNDRWSVALVPIREHAIGSFDRIAALVMGAVALVLLIACANVTSLTLARGTERSAEVAIRTALGASRGRVVRALLVESLPLSLAGCAAGTLIAWYGLPALVHLIPTNAGVPFLSRAAIDLRVLGFAAGIALACGAAASLLPARQAFRVDVIEALRGNGRGHVSTVTTGWRRMLVAGEVALAVVVIACAILMMRTVLDLGRVRAGFDTEHVAKLRTSLRGDSFATPAARIGHFEELQRRLAQLPGVTLVSGTSFEPPFPAADAVRLRIPGFPEDTAAPPSAVFRIVLADYFETVGTPILRGRGITRNDRLESAPVAVISESMAKKYFPNVDPIGRSFALDVARAKPVQIVGVCGDAITQGTDPTPQAAFYAPYSQNAGATRLVMTMVMRVPAGNPAAPLALAEKIAWSIAPSVNVYAVETMPQRMHVLNWQPRFTASVLGGFALVGLVLAAAGLYAVVSYTVVQRRSEIGLRMALGASARAILVDVIGDGVKTVAIGLTVGNVAALGFTRLLGGMLYGVAPGDPLTLVAVSIAMLAVAVAASAAPAFAAARVDPHVALR